MIINQRKIIYFLSYLLLLIPLALITGPFLPDLFLAVIVISFIMIIFVQKKIEILDNIYFKIYLIICLILSLNSFSSNNLSSLQSSIFYFRFGIFALACYFLINNNQNILKNLLYIFITIYFALFIDSLYQYFFLKNILGFTYNNEQNFRITSFFGKDEILGSYTARFFPVLLFLLTYCHNLIFLRKKNILKIILFLTSFVVVLLSGERTSLALFIIFIIFIFISSYNYRRLLLVPIIACFVIFTLTVLYSEKIYNRVIVSTINQLGLDSKSERMYIFSKTYEGHYKIALNMFLEKPILGHGAKMFRYYCDKEENFVAANACTTHPHNFYAQTLAETGISGFLVLLSLYIFIFYLFLKNLYFQIINKSQVFSDEALCLLGFYFITLFPFLPSGNFFNNWLSIVNYYPLGFLIYLIKKNKFYVR
tara:strand:- start:5514 stop:6782 length:1269 start_codon:yes stop_codon:yes gene_type:complete